MMSQAVLIAIGIDWDGRRQILAVEMANRESRSSWNDFLLGLRRRGLSGVEFVITDDHAGLRASRPRGPPRSRLPALLRPLPAQRPRPSAAQGRRRLPAGTALALRPALASTRPASDLAAWIAKWGAHYPKLVAWVEETIEETFTFYRLPRQHHKHLKSTNMLERFNEEIRRRTSSCASSPTQTPADASSAPLPSKLTRTGSRPTATSI